MPPQPPEKRRGGRPRKNDAEALPGAILDAAWELFREEGYRGASVDALAARAGVSKRTLYDRFGSKDAVFEAMFTRASEQWQEEVLARLNVPADDWLDHFTGQMLEMLGRVDLLALSGFFSVESHTYPIAARVEAMAARRALEEFSRYLASHMPAFPTGAEADLVTRGTLALLSGWAANFSRVEPKVSAPALRARIAGELRALLVHHRCMPA